MGACNPFRNKRRHEPPSWAAPFSPGDEGLQNSLEPSGHVLSPGEGVHPEKHLNMPESASFLAKKKKKKTTGLLERFRLDSQKDFLRQSSRVLGVGEEYRDFAALPTFLALRSSSLRRGGTRRAST